MKQIFISSIVVLVIILGITSCQDRIDYSPDIALLKSQVAALKKTTDSLNNALKVTNSQLSTTNLRIDELTSKISLINSQILVLTNDLTKVNANISLIISKLEDLQKQIDDLRKLINDLSTKPSTLETGLVLFYPFTGNANDLSGNGRDGIVSGATLTIDRYGKSSSAYYFNGVVGTKIQSNYSGILGNESRSISVWVKRTEPIIWSSHVMYWGKPSKNDYNLPGGNAYSILFANWDAQPFIGVDNGYSAVGTKTNIFLDNKWHNYIFIYDQLLGTKNSNIKIFIDGALSSNTVNYNPLNINTIDEKKLVIGETFNEGGWAWTFKGDIDDVRLYNRVLNNLEIAYLANH
jgi:hypothetical protein